MVSRALVSSGWLSGALKTIQAPSLQVLDSTWYSPGGKDARKEFMERHIPGALFFDMEECRDKVSPYEMMLPSQAQFAEYIGTLGINNQSHVVIYDSDSMGMLYAPRLWWMFRVFGHNNVSVLDGGLVNWVKLGLPVTSEITPAKPQKFNATLNRSLLKTFEDVQENLSTKKFQLVDARGEGRFWGPEPKPGEAPCGAVQRAADTFVSFNVPIHFLGISATSIEPGHVPGAVNLPFSGFLTPDGLQRPSHETRRLFQENGIDLEGPLTVTCRRGVTACHLALASFLLGKEDAAVYDGSWSEWFHRAKPEHKVCRKKDGA